MVSNELPIKTVKSFVQVVTKHLYVHSIKHVIFVKLSCFKDEKLLLIKVLKFWTSSLTSLNLLLFALNSLTYQWSISFKTLHEKFRLGFLSLNLCFHFLKDFNFDFFVLKAMYFLASSYRFYFLHIYPLEFLYRCFPKFKGQFHQCL